MKDDRTYKFNGRGTILFNKKEEAKDGGDVKASEAGSPTKVPAE